MHKILMYIIMQYVILKLMHIYDIMRIMGYSSIKKYHKEDRTMSIRYKIDVLASLKEAGYSSYRIRKEGIINQAALQRLREGKMIAWEQLNIICRLLHCQPGDIIEYTEE